jgi:HSP20 family protein
MADEKQKTEKNLTVRQPKARGQNLPSRLNDMFGQPFLTWGGFFNDNAMWAPPLDVVEKDDKFVAKVELPGVHEEDVSVAVLGDMLVVEGEKEAESEAKKKGYYYSESSYGSFSRSIPIPSIVDADRITANFDKGVLEIDLPKAVEIKPKKVNVTTKKKEKTVAKQEQAANNSKK